MSALGHKVGFKARHNRRRRSPMHKPRHKPLGYSRTARIMKARMREALAPTIEDFDGEQMAVRNARPLTSAVVACGLAGLSSDYSKRRGRAADTADPTTHGGNP